VKVTTKGQVTIPIEIREELGIYPGSDVEFQIDHGVAKLILIRKAPSGGTRLVEHMRGRATVKLTTAEIMALTRGGS